MAQEYTVEQLNHGRKVYDFMRWDYWAFGISGLLLIAAIVIMGVRGFNWGLDFTGGTVIEITLEKPAEMDVMREALQKAGFEEPQLQKLWQQPRHYGAYAANRRRNRRSGTGQQSSDDH